MLLSCCSNLMTKKPPWSRHIQVLSGGEHRKNKLLSVIPATLLQCAMLMFCP